MNYFELHIEVEQNCFLNCKHCSSYNSRTDKEIGYSLESVQKLISLVNAPTYIFLTGGEPLLNKEIYNTLSFFNKKKNDLVIGIFTSGVVNRSGNGHYILEDEALLLSSKGLKVAYFSIYHYQPKLHDRITGYNGSFDCTQKTMEAFITAGIETRAHLVITKYNIGELDYIIDYFAKRGICEIRLLRLVHNGNAETNWGDIGITYSEQEQAIENVYNSIAKYDCRITISGFPHLMPCRPFQPAYRCQGGTNVLYTTFDGSVYPCACTKGKKEFRISHISDETALFNYLNSIDRTYNENCLNPLTENTL